jgi:hypothetical protein
MEHQVNEQLQSKLVEILAGIQSATKAAGDFALEQLPDIAQQYVVYGRALASFWILLGAAFLIYAAVGATKCIRNARAGKDDWAFGFGFSGGIAAVIGMMFVCVNVSTFALVWFAPKVWLLKEIAGLLK